MCRGLTRLTQSPAAHLARVSPASSAALSVRRRRDVEYKSIAASTSPLLPRTVSQLHFPTFSGLDLLDLLNLLGLLTPTIALPAPLPLLAFALSSHGFSLSTPACLSLVAPFHPPLPCSRLGLLKSDTNACTTSNLSHSCLAALLIYSHSVSPFPTSLLSSRFRLILTTTTLV
jgi:hypothetical protein